ncbi:MAG TPA: hypothetical protein VMB03_32175 [Bryobacteraceae bacterium]|nr:hypothetical protein [Bryobacteraceae bacterium]
MKRDQPVFVTRQPLRIAEVRQLLSDAGNTVDPVVVFPDELEHAVAGAGDCLILIDGDSLPSQRTIGWLRQHSPGSRIVIWTEFLLPHLLLATIECNLDGLLSSHLPPEEAAGALARICRGERLLRFDSDPVSNAAPVLSRPLADAASFDAQWMLHGAEPQRREK